MPNPPPNPPRNPPPNAQKPRHRRLAIFSMAMAIVIAAISLMLIGLKDNIIFFHSPSAITEDPQNPKFQKKFRIGGLVKHDSIIDNNHQINFILTDNVNDITIAYDGILPALFREGQGIVALGRMNQKGVFIAEQLLAKHDENYMPQEAVQALKDAGVWKGQ